MLQFLFAGLLLNSARAMDFEVASAKTGSGQTVNVVHMQGLIDPQDWRRFMGATSMLDAKQDTLFTVNSPGGNAQLGLFLISKVDSYLKDQVQAGRKVWIVVEQDCSSMCVPLYFSFANRFAQTGARIGLHAVSVGALAYDPDMTKIYVDNLTRHASERGEIKALAFFNYVLQKGDFYSTTLDPYRADDLAAQDSGLIPLGAIVQSEAELLGHL